MSLQREVDLTAERLRQLSAARRAGAEPAFHALLGLLTDRPVPRLDSRAWADQLVVIARDVPADDAVLAAAVREFRRSLDLRVL